MRFNITRRNNHVTDPKNPMISPVIAAANVPSFVKRLNLYAMNERMIVRHITQTISIQGSGKIITVSRCELVQYVGRIFNGKILVG